jgi:hypothetical protein
MVRIGVPQRFDIMQHLLEEGLGVMQYLLLRIGVPKVGYYAAFTGEKRCSHEGFILCSIYC